LYFSEEQIDDLSKGLNQAIKQANEIIVIYTQYDFENIKAGEYARHGFARRIITLKQCFTMVFEKIPPELVGIPSRQLRKDAEIYIQAFVFNLFGALDNLAWVWVSETKLSRPNGKTLSKSAVGLSKDKKIVRSSFSQAFKSELEKYDTWYKNLENFRHTLAHRIPLYIPPCICRPEDEEQYLEIEKAEMQAMLIGDSVTQKKLVKEREKITYFRPLILHSFSEKSPTILFHSQLLADFATLHAIAISMQNELKTFSIK